MSASGSAVIYRPGTRSFEFVGCPYIRPSNSLDRNRRQRIRRASRVIQAQRSFVLHLRMASVFITGASGFMGRRLSAELVARGHSVRGLVRRGSEKHVALGCEGVTGDPLDVSTYQRFVAGCDTLVHLVGVAHPSPAKKQQFRTIDLASATQAVAAAASGGVRHRFTSAWLIRRRSCGTILRRARKRKTRSVSLA